MVPVRSRISGRCRTGEFVLRHSALLPRIGLEDHPGPPQFAVGDDGSGRQKDVERAIA